MSTQFVKGIRKSISILDVISGNTLSKAYKLSYETIKHPRTHPGFTIDKNNQHFSATNHETLRTPTHHHRWSRQMW